MNRTRSIDHAFDFPTILLTASLAGLSTTVAAMLLMGTSLIGQILIIAFFGLMNLALMVRSPGLFAFQFLVFYSGIGMLIANAVLSGSTYIVEADYTSYDIGALPLLALSLTTFFLSYSIIVWNFDIEIPPRAITSRVEQLICLVIAGVPIIVCCAAFLIYGSPWFTGSSRSAFWALGAVPQFFFTAGFNRLGPTVLLAGILFSLSRDPTVRKACLIIAAFNVGILILFGGRAGAIVSPALLFTLTIAFRLRRLHGKLFRRTMIFGGITALAVVAVSLASYAFQFTSTTGEQQQAFVGLFTRFILQGQVWWNIYYTVNVSHIGSTGATFWNEFSTFMDWSPSRAGRGSDLILRLVAPKVLYESAVRQDIIFAGGWPALGLYYFGPIALQFIQMLSGIFYALFGILFKREVLRGHFISVLILFFLWWQVATEAVTNAEWYIVFNIRTVSFALLYVAICAGRHFLSKLSMSMGAAPGTASQ